MTLYNSYAHVYPLNQITFILLNEKINYYAFTISNGKMIIFDLQPHRTKDHSIHLMLDAGF